MHIPVTISNHPSKTILEILQLMHIKTRKAYKKSIAIVKTATNQSICFQDESTMWEMLTLPRSLDCTKHRLQTAHDLREKSQHK